MLAGPERRLRGHADDAAPAGLAHRRHSGARHEKGAAGVDPHRALPGFDRHILDLVAVGTLRRAGIVDENVEPAIAPQDLLDHTSGIRLDADIAKSGRGGPAAAHQFLDEAVDAAPRTVHIAFDIVLVGDPGRHDIGNDNGYPRRCERSCRRITDANRFAAAGNQSDAGGARHKIPPRNPGCLKLTAPTSHTIDIFASTSLPRTRQIAGLAQIRGVQCQKQLRPFTFCWSSSGWAVRGPRKPRMASFPRGSRHIIRWRLTTARSAMRRLL